MRRGKEKLAAICLRRAKFKLPIIVKSRTKPNPSFYKCVLTIKADESTNCEGSCGSYFHTGLCIFSSGASKFKMHLKNRISRGLSCISNTIYFKYVLAMKADQSADYEVL